MKLVQFHNSQSESSMSAGAKAAVILETSVEKDVGNLEKIGKLAKHVDFDPILRVKARKQDLSLL